MKYRLEDLVERPAERPTAASREEPRPDAHDNCGGSQSCNTRPDAPGECGCMASGKRPGEDKFHIDHDPPDLHARFEDAEHYRDSYKKSMEDWSMRAADKCEQLAAAEKRAEEAEALVRFCQRHHNPRLNLIEAAMATYQLESYDANTRLPRTEEALGALVALEKGKP